MSYVKITNNLDELAKPSAASMLAEIVAATAGWIIGFVVFSFIFAGIMSLVPAHGAEWPNAPLTSAQVDTCQDVAEDRWNDVMDEGEEESTADHAAAVAFDWCVTNIGRGA
jgi:hypothetical protein